MSPQLLVEDLRHAYDGVQALDGVSLTVGRGRVEALLGPNGAGKTTLIRIVTTLLRPDSGRVEVAGHDISEEKAAIRRHVALSGQQIALDMDAPGLANLRTFARLAGLARPEREARCAELVAAFGLDDVAMRTVATYSGGERRRLDLAVAMLRKPSVLLLDEPTVGLDPRHRREVWDFVRRLAMDGVAVLLTTQYLEEADELADHVTIIDRGTVVAAGPPAALKSATGRAVLTLAFADAEAARRATEVLAVDGRESTIQAERVAVPVGEGGEDVPELLLSLHQAGSRPSSMRLREPTLDDAFLLIVGRPANPAEGQLVAGARSRR